MNGRSNWQQFREAVLPIFRAAHDEEIELRCRLLLIRDLAIQALGYSNEEAYHLLRAVSEMAGRYAMAEITISQLREIRRILIMTSAAANSMQVLTNEIHYSGAEGSNARG